MANGALVKEWFSSEISGPLPPLLERIARNGLAQRRATDGYLKAYIPGQRWSSPLNLRAIQQGLSGVEVCPESGLAK